MPEHSPTPRMVSVRDAAKMLSLHPITVRKSFPLHRVGNKALVRISDIQRITGEGQTDARP